MTSLPDYLIEQSAPDNDPTDAPDEVREAWQIDGDNQANWALRKQAKADQEIARIKAAANAEIEKIKAWQADALKKPERDAEFFAGKLTDWHMRNIYAAAKEAGAEWTDEGLAEVWAKLPKSRKLPAGTVSARMNPESVEVVDEETFVGWAMAAGYEDFLRVKPNVSELKRLRASGDGAVITPEGEAVPGVQRKPGAISFTAKPTTDEQPAWLPYEGDDA